MSPTIRIDDEVYNWLQSKAQPFEDTPNSVLRRIAGLEVSAKDDCSPEQHSVEPQLLEQSRKSRQMSQGRSGLSGRLLNDRWGVGARHALYHQDGHFYENLKQFPGALFDPNGYILFQTREEYESSLYLTIGKKTNVPNGIASIPQYVQKALHERS